MTNPTAPAKKLSDFKPPLSPEDHKELLSILHKLQRSQTTLRNEYDNFAVLASEAYSPYTRKLKFATKPSFVISDEDLPISLRKIPQVPEKRWGFIANPEYLDAKKKAKALLVPYLLKNKDIFLSPLSQRLETIQYQITQIHKLLETR